MPYRAKLIQVGTFDTTHYRQTDMTYEQLEVIRQLRAEGCAVIIWTPEEIGRADIDQLEDLAISRGNDYLESVNGED